MGLPLLLPHSSTRILTDGVLQREKMSARRPGVHAAMPSSFLINSTPPITMCRKKFRTLRANAVVQARRRHPRRLVESIRRDDSSDGRAALIKARLRRKTATAARGGRWGVPRTLTAHEQDSPDHLGFWCNAHP